ncbi:hypothetical protein OC842_007465, partial [Tilletia horrida]
MVAPPRSSAPRTGEDYDMLLQAQHAESAVQDALTEPRPAAQAPAQLKVEVGLSPGPTIPLDKVGVPSPSPVHNTDSETGRLHQEQHRSDAAQGVRSPPDSIAQVPTDLKDEAGDHRRTTTSIGDGSIGPSPTASPEDTQSTACLGDGCIKSSIGTEAQDEAEQDFRRQLDRELTLVSLWLSEQRPQGAADAWSPLNILLSHAWHVVDWHQVEPHEDGYLCALEVYHDRLAHVQEHPELYGQFPIPVDLIGHELTSVDKLGHAIARGDRRSELQLAEALTARYDKQEVEADQQPPCPTCAERNKTVVETEPSEPDQVQGDKEQELVPGRTYGDLVRDLWHQHELSLQGQAAVSQAAFRLQRAERRSMDAQVKAASRRHTCLDCFRRQRAFLVDHASIFRSLDKHAAQLVEQEPIPSSHAQDPPRASSAAPPSPDTCRDCDPVDARKAPRTVGHVSISLQSPRIQPERKPPDRSHRDAADDALTAVGQRQDAIDAERYAIPSAGHTLVHANSSSSTPSKDDHRSARAQDEPAASRDVLERKHGNLCSSDSSAAATEGDDARGSCRMEHQVGIDSDSVENAQVVTAVHGQNVSVIVFGDMSFGSDGMRPSLGNATDTCFSHITSTSKQRTSSPSATCAVGSRSAARPHKQRLQRIQFGNLPPAAAHVKLTTIGTRGITSSRDAGTTQDGAQQQLPARQRSVVAASRHRPEAAQPVRPLSDDALRPAIDQLPRDGDSSCDEEAVPPDKQSCASVHAERAHTTGHTSAEDAASSADRGTGTCTPLFATCPTPTSTDALGTAPRHSIGQATSANRQQQAPARVAVNSTGSQPATSSLPGSVSAELQPKRAGHQPGNPHTCVTAAPGRATSTTLPGPTGPGPPTRPCAVNSPGVHAAEAGTQLSIARHQHHVGPDSTCTPATELHDEPCDVLFDS